jgi:hypothetical protein
VRKSPRADNRPANRSDQFSASVVTFLNIYFISCEIAEEKKIWVARSADERTRFEHHLQDVLSDNLRVQTQMKTDLSHVALCLKVLTPSFFSFR